MKAIGTVLKITWLSMLFALCISLKSERVEAQSVLFGAAHNATGDSTLYRIDPATGVATAVGPIGFQGCNGMDFDASWTLFATCRSAAGNIVLITIDQETGTGQLVGDTEIAMINDALEVGSDISFRPSDDVLFSYFLDEFSDDLLGTINLATGAVTDVSMGGPAEMGNGMAFSPSGDLYLAGTKISSFLGLLGVKLHLLEQVAGEDGSMSISSSIKLILSETPDGNALQAPRLNAMDFEPRTGILFASVNDGGVESYLAIVNPSDGKVSFIGKTQDSLDAMAFVPVITEAIPTVPTGAPYLKCNKVARGRYIKKYEELDVMVENSSETVKVRVSRPESLCTVLYDDGGVLTESDTTLACYHTKNVMRYRKERGSLTFEWRQVYIDNEFGEQAFSAIQHQTLCVPSEIKDEKVKIKTFYHKRHRHEKDDD